MVIALAVWSSLFISPGGVGQPALVARAFLAADLSPKARLAALSRVVGVGDSMEVADRTFDRSGFLIGHGPGFLIVTYWMQDGALISVGCYPDGEIHTISYKGKEGKSASVASKGSITWPKSPDRHRAPRP